MKIVLTKADLQLLSSLTNKEIGLMIRVLSISDVVNGEIFFDHDTKLIDVYRKLHDPFTEDD